MLFCHRQEQEVQAAAESAAAAGPWQRAMGGESENLGAIIERHVTELESLQVLLVVLFVLQFKSVLFLTHLAPWCICVCMYVCTEGLVIASVRTGHRAARAISKISGSAGCRCGCAKPFNGKRFVTYLFTGGVASDTTVRAAAATAATATTTTDSPSVLAASLPSSGRYI